MTLRHWLNRYRRRVTYYIEDKIWMLRMRAVYHLVGDRSFAANIEVVGALHMPNIRFGCELARDVFVCETEEQRQIWKSEQSKRPCSYG
jgi:hypothetical protein